MNVYWLRIIIDEGHVMGKKQSNQSNIATNLLCERRWACTGTPTPGNRLLFHRKDVFHSSVIP